MKILNITKITAVAGLLFLCSCENYLDVDPSSTIKGNDLLQNESGYKEALAGVYTSMVNNATYAKELRFGMIGVMGQEWDYYPASTYSDASLYDYTATSPEAMISSMWSQMYNGVANANNIINTIDGKKNIFSGNNYSIIKGEALALRAMLHFDILRCFGASYAQNSEMPSIPYCTELQTKSFPQLKVSQVVELILNDLKQADSILMIDPIRTGEIITEINDNGYLINRQMHMNYYAVKALEARVYLWSEDYVNANKCASEVVESGVFNWSTQRNMLNGVDNCNAPEQIFALNNAKLSTLADTYFSSDNTTAGFHSDAATILTMFDGNTDDYRYLYQYSAGTGTTASYRYLNKYNSTSAGDSLYYADKMSMIRLSEMYLIQSECQYNMNGESIDGLNEVRKARSITQYIIDPADYYAALIAEYKREFISEGQIFFLYKRLNYEYIPGSSAINMYDTKGYIFPLPKSETEVAVRESNR